MGMRSKFAINVPFYQWSVRAFSVLRKRLGMKIETHAAPGTIEDGQIFLFNHFARFETIIPQYFIYQATGAYCRCVATHELFESSERFANILWGVGAVPSNHPGLLAFLAAEILRGQKVIIFPEGSMMKDRSIAAPPHESFLQSLRPRMGHHQGAAALAVILEVFKKRILSVLEANDFERLDRWVAALGLKDQEALIAAARKPTLIVPSNITFHPLHTGENVLLRAADFLKFKLNQKGREELQVEGNLLLRDTDMDIRFGKPVDPDFAWSRADRLGLTQIFEQIDSLDDLFGLKDKATDWSDRLAALTIRRTTQRLRDQCMVEMYANVTMNISHLASALILRLAEAKVSEISTAEFHAKLYAIIKSVQKEPGLHLHRSLADPEAYEGLHRNQSSFLDDFYKSANGMRLLEIDGAQLKFLPALQADTGIRDPRLTNIIRVYANEIASLTKVTRLIAEAVPLTGVTLGQSLYDDELRGYQKDKRDIAQRMKASAGPQLQNGSYGAASLILPEKVTKHGVVLVHGVLASPVELRAFAQRLVMEGHPVLNVRLKGHGTAPEDLHDRNWPEWLSSVRRGFEIMAHISRDVSVVGFATGASLALLLAAEKPAGLAAVVAVSAPLKFRASGLRFASALNFANTIGKWLYLKDGIKPFQIGQPEHPEFEHEKMPVRALAELHEVAETLLQRLPLVSSPVMIIQASDDPVADPTSAAKIYELVGSPDKRIHIVTSDRHAILHENIGNTQGIIIARLAEVAAPAALMVPENAGRRRLRDWKLLRWVAPHFAFRGTVDAPSLIDQS
jgi:esterase/lipase